MRILALLLLVSSVVADRPNVVVVMVDDLGWTDLGCMGSTYYETPHIDRLASEGVLCTDAYAAAAVCSPSRAALLTGRYPARLGLTDWIRARFQGTVVPEDRRNPTAYVRHGEKAFATPPNPLWMEHEEVTLAERLRDAGYATCHIGKWHLGPDDWYPESQGFDENHGGCDLGQPPSYFDPYVARGVDIPTLEPRREGEYLSDREGDEAASFIRRHRDESFFLYLAPYAVHTPIQAHPDLVGKYESKAKGVHSNAKYASMVESVDRSVGKVLETLDDLGLRERTLIVFTSDNGGLLGPTQNVPLRLGKGHPYEGGIRVPFIASWTGVLPEDVRRTSPISGIDVAPTVLEAIGIEAPASLDGMSVLDHLRDGEPLATRALYWHFPHYRSARITPFSVVREGHWKLVYWWDGDRTELYRLDDDPSEARDVARDYPDECARLRTMLESHLDEVGGKRPRPAK